MYILVTMPTPKQLVVCTLKNLAHQCLREQFQLKKTRMAQRILKQQEATARAKIRHLKTRINNELIQHSGTLGLNVVPPPDTFDSSDD